MANIYKSYLNLLNKWPLDATKKHRNLGQHIRQQIKVSFKAGELASQLNEDKCKQTYESLNRIADNYYKRLYERTYHSGSTGLTADQCKTIISDDFMELLKQDETSFFSKVMRR